MIFVEGKYEAKRNQFGWVLTEYREGADKDGNPKIYGRDSYYASLHQICTAVIDREAGECKDVFELRALLNDAGRLLLKEAKSVTA